LTTPINLNKARKQKARADKEQRAVENRAKFGRTKSEKLADKVERERAAKIVDLSKRDK
jgi:Spy/CpxP family protein refolding chaperone